MTNTVQKKEKFLQNQIDNMDIDIELLRVKNYRIQHENDNFSLLNSPMNSNPGTHNSINFISKYLGALICNDIGSRTYNNVYESALQNFNIQSLNDLSSDTEKENFLLYMKNHLQTSTNCNGYQIIDFRSMNGFDGGIYENNGDYIVVCRGTEFQTSNEELYKDFINSDVLKIGRNQIPSDFKYTLELLRRAEQLANGDHSKIHIVGHSLGGAVAQLLGALYEYRDIDVTTYNAVGVGHLIDNLKNTYDDLTQQKFAVQTNAKNATNINNYATCNDFVSTIFNIIGNKIQLVEPNSKNQAKQHAAEWKIKGEDPNIKIYTKVITDQGYASSFDIDGIKFLINNL